MTTSYAVIDIEAAQGAIARTTVDLPAVFDLGWIEPAYAFAPAESLPQHVRTRRFKHFGAAVVWARRALFHHKVFGDSIEMTSIRRKAYGPVVALSDPTAAAKLAAGAHPGDVVVDEKVKETVDITLLGFRAWRCNATAVTWLEPPTRKTRKIA